MPWFRIDDQFHAHPKVVALFDGPSAGDALALWTLAGSWCAAGLTEGHVTIGLVRRLGFAPGAAEELVRVGLWERTEGGYVFHDWLDFNPSREQVEEERSKAADRMRRKRRSPGVRANTEDVRANAARTSPEVPPSVRSNFERSSPSPTRPVPTRPDPMDLGGGSRARAREAPDPPPDSEAAAAAADALALASKLAMRRAVESVGGIYQRDDRPEHTTAGRDVAAWAEAAGRPLDEVLDEWASDWVSRAERRSATSWARYVADRVAGAAWGTVAKAGRLPPQTGEGFEEPPEDPDELARIFEIGGRRHG